MVTYIFWRFLILEMFVMGLVFTDCRNSHLQTKYCTSDFVFLAERPQTVGDEGPYDLKINRIYKGKRGLKSISQGNMVKMETNLDFKNLTQGILSDSYLFVFGEIKDGQVQTGTFYPYRWLTSDQQTGLARNYRRGCDCIDEIGPTFDELACEYLYSFMIKRNGKCTWIKTSGFKKCTEFLNWIRSKKTEEC